MKRQACASFICDATKISKTSSQLKTRNVCHSTESNPQAEPMMTVQRKDLVTSITPPIPLPPLSRRWGTYKASSGRWWTA